MPNLRRTINRLKDPRDLWLFLKILVMLIKLPRLIGCESLPALLNQLDPGVYPGSRDELTLRKTVGFTDTLLRYRIFQKYGKCLTRSLTLFRLLRQQGWPVGIHFGVRKVAADAAHTELDEMKPAAPDAATLAITGHCWLVLDAEPFLEEGQDEEYVTTYAYPSLHTVVRE